MARPRGCFPYVWDFLNIGLDHHLIPNSHSSSAPAYLHTSNYALSRTQNTAMLVGMHPPLRNTPRDHGLAPDDDGRSPTSRRFGTNENTRLTRLFARGYGHQQPRSIQLLIGTELGSYPFFTTAALSVRLAQHARPTYNALYPCTQGSVEYLRLFPRERERTARPSAF